MNRRQGVLAAVVLAVGASSAALGSECELSATASVRSSGTQQLFLDFRLQNVGKRACVLSSAWGPWGNPSSLILMAVEANGFGISLTRSPNEAYPLGGETRLESGQSKIGSIELLSEFPELRRALKEQPVVVFWSFTPRTPDMSWLKPLAGTVTLDRQGPRETGPRGHESGGSGPERVGGQVLNQREQRVRA